MIQETVDGLHAHRDALVAAEVIDRLELARRIREAGDDDVTEEYFRDGTEAEAIEQRAEDELGADGVCTCALAIVAMKFWMARSESESSGNSGN